MIILEQYSFTNRQKRIIAELVNSTIPVKGKSLAIILDLSLRTIQKEISLINKELSLIKSSNKGYSIDSNLLPSFTVFEEDEKDLNHQLLKKLFFSKKSIRIEELADMFFISLSTLENKLREIDHELEKFCLRISRHKGLLNISGTELNKRRFISSLIMNEVDPTFNTIDNLSSFFGEIDLSKTKSIILNAIHKYDFFVEKNYSSNLLINIILALYRMRTDSYIETIPDSLVTTDSVEYRISLDICNQYADHWHIQPKENDIIYVATLIMGQIKPISLKESDEYSLEVITQDFIGEINDILLETFNYYLLDINYQQFLYNFALHIDGLIKRASSIQLVSNEVLDNLKRNCPFIYEVAISISEKIASKYGIFISDEEIGYISIHIGFLIENSTEDTRLIKILLLTKDYHRISDNIMKKLNETHGDHIEIRSTNNGAPENSIDSTVDLIISTNPINVIGKKVVTVSPFFSLMDQLEVDNAIRLCIKEKELNYQNKLLSSFFHEKLFFKTSKIQTKEEAIKFLSQEIIDFGLAEADFTESVFRRETMSSTCFFDTFAIPHAIEMNAKKTMFCVLINEEGIKWGENNINIVLMIAVQKDDRKKFMDIYNTIVKILWDKEKANLLAKSNNFEEFIFLLKHQND